MMVASPAVVTRQHNVGHKSPRKIKKAHPPLQSLGEKSALGSFCALDQARRRAHFLCASGLAACCHSFDLLSNTRTFPHQNQLQGA